LASIRPTWNCSNEKEATVNLHEAIYQRRAVRHFRPEEVEVEAVQRLLEAAVQAPSVLNQQPWAFGVFHGRQRLEAWSDRAKGHLLATFPTTMELHLHTEEFYSRDEYNVFHGADTLIVIYATKGREKPEEQCFLAAQNLMLAASDLGLGTCPIGYVRSWLNLPEIKRELGVPDHYTAVFPVVVGYPAGEPEAVPRRPPEIVSWQWGEPQAVAAR
jgi:nitroreductase